MTIHSMIEDLKEQAKERAKSTREKQAQDKFREELATVCAKDLARMSETDLAAWQSQYPSPSPQATLASFEWQRRLTAMQVRSARFAAWLGLLGVVLGAALTVLVAKLLQH
jgi:hypothetical protein